ICVGVIGVAANKASLCRQRELHIALRKRQLGTLALCNVTRQTRDPQKPPRRIKLAFCRLLQPYLFAVRTDVAEPLGIGSAVGAEFAQACPESLAVIGMDVLEEIAASPTGFPVLF